MKRLKIAFGSFVALGFVIASSTYASDWTLYRFSGHGNYSPLVNHSYSQKHTTHEVSRHHHEGHGTFLPHGGIGYGQIHPAYHGASGQRVHGQGGHSPFHGSSHGSFTHGHGISTGMPKFWLQLGH